MSKRPSSPPSVPPKPSLLVVDDEPANLKTFQRVFRRDFLMTPCASAKEALAALRHDNFDVIIADQSMPELSGVELLRLVVVAAPQMRRAMCTGYPDLPEVIEAQRSGLAQIVIMKPWNADEVRRWIHHLVKLGTMHDAVAKLRQSVDGPERK